MQPATVIRWHREGFSRCLDKQKRSPRRSPELDREVRALIRKMSTSNPTCGAPRIRNELAKIGIFRVLFVLLIVAHDRRRILHFNVTSSPSAQWTAQQVVQAFPNDCVPRYLLRDRDCIYGKYFRHRVKNLGIKEVLTAARSPWQNPYVERLIGSIRRECLGRVIVLNEQHLRRILRSYFQYYHRSRYHLSLDGDTPEPRSVQGPELGKVIELPDVGGLHYTLRAGGRMIYRRIEFR